MTAAQIIREARLKAGLTQTELASRLGRERAQVARWETGGQEPSFANLTAAVEACGYALDVAIVERAPTPELDAELEASVPQAPQQRVQALLEKLEGRAMSSRPRFDPYELLAALDQRARQLRDHRRLRAGRPRKRRGHRRARHRAVVT